MLTRGAFAMIAHGSLGPQTSAGNDTGPCKRDCSAITTNAMDILTPGESVPPEKGALALCPITVGAFPEPVTQHGSSETWPHTTTSNVDLILALLPCHLPLLGSLPLSATERETMRLILDLSFRRDQRQRAVSQEGLQMGKRLRRLDQEVRELMAVRKPTDVDTLLLTEILGYKHIKERLALRRH